MTLLLTVIFALLVSLLLVSVSDADYPKNDFPDFTYFHLSHNEQPKFGRKFVRQGDANETAELIKERLPRVAEIHTYNLFIFPHVPFGGVPSEEKDFTFDGNVTTVFTIKNDTDKFPFYSKGLKINKVELKDESGQSLKVQKWDVDESSTLGFVQAAEKFQIGHKYQLFFEFQGKLKNLTTSGSTKGFFYIQGKRGDDDYYTVSTHFEPMQAREMFPHADDPHFKAIFNLSVVHPKTATIFSNSEHETDTDYDKFHTLTKFKPTPYMSSYLLTFVFSNYQIQKSKSKSGVPISVASFTRTGEAAKALDKHLQYSAEIAAKCLNSMENLVKVPYNHSKLDHVEAVRGFAMENFGIVTHDNWLARSPIGRIELYNLVMIICHETAHQWFGDLVTADNWGQIFLHESFASFFQDQTLLEGNITDTAVVQDQIHEHRVRGMDKSLENNHPIVIQTQSFDDVIYLAGGAILRMVHTAIGDEKFYGALKIYLEAHQYGTATYTDLIDAFDKMFAGETLCGNLTIRDVLTDFLLQTYFPYIHIHVKDKEYTFDQSPASEKSNDTWNVPMFVQEVGENKDTETHVLWLLKNNSVCSKTLKLPIPSDKKFEFNANLRSFAYVNESKFLWDRKLQMDLSQLSDDHKLALLEQATFKDSANNPQDYKHTRELTQKLVDLNANDADTPPLLMAAQLYAEVHPNERSKLYRYLTWTPSSYYEEQFNKYFMTLAVTDNFEDYRQKSLELFRDFKKNCSGKGDLLNCNEIPAEKREAAYCAAILSNDTELVGFVQTYKAEIRQKKSKEASVEEAVLQSLERRCKSTN